MQTPSKRRRGTGTWLVAAALGLALFASVAALYLYQSRRAPGPAGRVATVPVEEPAAPAPVGAPAMAAPEMPAPEVLLPPIDESDPFVRELVRQVSSHPQVAGWLVSDHLIRGFVAGVANVSLGDSPAPQLGFLAPEGGFVVNETDSGTYVAPQSYARYDLFADAFASLDLEGTANLYATLHPLLASAYRDLGHDDSFDDAMALAIERLLEVPVPGDRVSVSRLVMTYEYSDPELEALDAAQRHFLRMGPRNVRIVQAKLRELAPALGIGLR